MFETTIAFPEKYKQWEAKSEAWNGALSDTILVVRRERSKKGLTDYERKQWQLCLGVLHSLLAFGHEAFRSFATAFQDVDTDLPGISPDNVLRRILDNLSVDLSIIQRAVFSGCTSQKRPCRLQRSSSTRPIASQKGRCSRRWMPAYCLSMRCSLIRELAPACGLFPIMTSC